MAGKTKEKIILAAVELISEKGKHGARMEEIAAAAGVNKAMIYYYFSDRDTLYSEVLRFVVKEMLTKITGKFSYIINDINDPAEKIRALSDAYGQAIGGNQQYFRIMFEAMSGCSDQIHSIVRETVGDLPGFSPDMIRNMLHKGIENGDYRDIPFPHFMNALIGLQISFFVTKPIFTAIIEMDEKSEKEYIKERQEIVPDILLNGILAKGDNK
ncbi:TetR/AcrR family transcriptional regulator [candidate division KSB1 bacterium]